jgi:Cadherin domain
LLGGAGDSDNGSFVLDGSNGQLRTAASFDYKTKRSYSIGVAARPDGVSSEVAYGARTLTISVTDVNDPLTDISLSNASVAEKQPVGTSVGTLSTTDQDAGDTFTYSLVSGDGSSDNRAFSIDGSTLRTAASFDYVAKSSYSIRVRSTDSGGKSIEHVFNIIVVDATRRH